MGLAGCRRVADRRPLSETGGGGRGGGRGGWGVWRGGWIGTGVGWDEVGWGGREEQGERK